MLPLRHPLLRQSASGSPFLANSTFLHLKTVASQLVPADQRTLFSASRPSHPFERQLSELLRSSARAGNNWTLLLATCPCLGPEWRNPLMQRAMEAGKLLRANVINILKDLYGIEGSRPSPLSLGLFLRGPARDMGFGRSMILGYGHDDRSSSFPNCAKASATLLLVPPSPS